MRLSTSYVLFLCHYIYKMSDDTSKMQSQQPDFRRKKNGWFIATFLPHDNMSMRQHMFQVPADESMWDAIIEPMLMYPKPYGLDGIMTSDETVSSKDFLATYRIFRVESTHSTCWRHAEINNQELHSGPAQDILITHIDANVGLKNELLLQYQVSSVQRTDPNDSVLHIHDKGVDMLLSQLAAQI